MPACIGTEAVPASPLNTCLPATESLADILGKDTTYSNTMATSAYTIPVDSRTGDVTGHELIKQQLQQLQQQEMLEGEDGRKTYASLEPAVSNNNNNGSVNNVHHSNHNFSGTHLNSSNNTDSNIQDGFDWSLLDPKVHDLKSWTMSHPDSWTSHQVLDWIYHVVQNMPDIQSVQGEKFNSLTGRQLCLLTREQFMALEPNYGQKFHELLQHLLSESIFTPPGSQDEEPAPALPVCTPSSSVHLPAIDCVLPPVHNNSFSSACQNNMIYCGEDPSFGEQVASSTKADMSVLDDYLADCGFGDISTSDFEEELPDFHPPECGSEYSSADSSSSLPPSPPESPELSDMWQVPAPLQNSPSHINVPNFGTLLRQPLVHVTGVPTGVMDQRPQPKKRGRPRKERLPSEYGGGGSDGESQRRSNRGRKHGQTTKCTHLWEFVRDLLKNPAHNPGTLKWEDKREGVFRFVKSEKVAHLWGQVKKNPAMTYEKLSRAMRFCRTTDYFSEVPRNGKYPKKLCFRFGAKATGWQ